MPLRLMPRLLCLRGRLVPVPDLFDLIFHAPSIFTNER